MFDVKIKGAFLYSIDAQCEFKVDCALDSSMLCRNSLKSISILLLDEISTFYRIFESY